MARWSTDFTGVRFHHLGPWVILVPVVGGLVVGVMAKYGSSKIKGYVIPEAMKAVLTNRSRMEPKVALLKANSAAIAMLFASLKSGSARDPPQMGMRPGVTLVSLVRRNTRLDLGVSESIIVDTFMTSGRTGRLIAILAVLGVLGIFFFPAMQGPYPVVHGPVSALLSVRAAAGLHLAIVRAGLDAVRNCLDFARLAFVVSAWTVVPTLGFAAWVDGNCDLNLRC